MSTFAFIFFFVQACLVLNCLGAAIAPLGFAGLAGPYGFGNGLLGGYGYDAGLAGPYGFGNGLAGPYGFRNGLAGTFGAPYFY